MPTNLFNSRHRTPKGVPYALMEGPEIEYTGNGDGQLTAGYQVYVADLADFIDEMMPSPFQVPGTSRIILAPTLKITNYPGYPAIFSPIRAVVSGFSDDLPTDWFAFDTTAHPKTYNSYAKVSITFTVNQDSFFTIPRSNANPEQFLEPSISTSAEVVSYKVDKNFKASDALTTGPAGKQSIKDFTAPTVSVIPISERSYKWTWALNPDFNTIFGLLGRLNNAALAWMDYSPPGTVMFMGLTGRREYRWANGGRSRIFPWNLEYKFSQRSGSATDEAGNSVPLTWNHFFNPDTGTFQYLTRDIGGSGTLFRPTYDTGDFNNLYLAKVA